jgi:hypothetical protein
MRGIQWSRPFAHRSFQRLGAPLLACGMLLAVTGTATAGITNFTIQREASEIDLTVDGTFFGGAATIMEQYPGSETFYMGDIVAGHASNSVDFVGNSNAEADNLREQVFIFSLERNVSPGVGGNGPASPANYGIETMIPTEIALPDIPLGDLTLSLGTLMSVDIDIAIRDLVLDLTSAGPLAINPGDDTFDATQVDVSIAQGFADIGGSLVFQQEDFSSWLAATFALNALAIASPELGITVTQNLGNFTNSVGLGTRVDISGATILANMTALDGTAVGFDSAGLATLTVPLDFEITPDLGIDPSILDLDLKFSGQLVAEALVPEPSTLVLSVMGAMFLAGTFWRRRRRA